jgi:dTDP-4-dehydrorhamnose reductase
MRWLIYGSKGWIGSMVITLLKQAQEEVIEASVRADDEVGVEAEILRVQPDRIMSFIGRTRGDHFTSIDYLEQKGKLVENIKDNLYGPLTLAILAKKHNIHYTYLGTGCIFSGYPQDGYTENDKPDFFGSSYSVVKGYTDRLMHTFDDSALNVRIRMPISTDTSDRNFIIKILHYKKICNMDNSMTVLPELLPYMIDMAKNKLTGTVNLTNPGVICHNEILQLVRDIALPELTWENFTVQEQNAILLSERSNNMLNTHKLEDLYPQVLPIKTSVRNIVEALKNKL